MQLIAILFPIRYDGIIIKINVNLFLFYFIFSKFFLMSLPHQNEIDVFATLINANDAKTRRHLLFILSFFISISLASIVVVVVVVVFCSTMSFGSHLARLGRKNKYRTHQINDSLWTCCRQPVYSIRPSFRLSV